jgi:alcohol dehydrogenase class IV
MLHKIQPFNFFVPTQILFGEGKLKELKNILSSYGKKGLLVSRPSKGSLKETYKRIYKMLEKAGISYIHFDEVIPNPTLEGVEEGVKLAAQHQVDFVLGVGGGSVLDTAKLIAFLHKPSGQIDWKEAVGLYDNPFAVSEPTIHSIPFIAVTTTSGSGSQCTQAGVVSDTSEQNKITLFHSGLFPSVSIVDPELMCSVPASVTAATGFDAFTHAFESYLGGRTSPLTEQMSLQAIKLVLENLPKAIVDPGNIEIRSQLALADTLAGMCLANGGADLPHPLGEIIGGICPRVAHGETLAMVYPAFLNYKEKVATGKFKKVSEYLGFKSDSKILTETLLELIDITNLSKAFEKAEMTKEEINSIKSHPLLAQLQPDNSDAIYLMMNNSLK